MLLPGRQIGLFFCGPSRFGSELSDIIKINKQWTRRKCKSEFRMHEESFYP
jgi:hypothetical protein